MGTKNNPAPSDCYEKAEPDEPLFTLLARDATAPHIVRHWAMLRGAQFPDDPKVAEAAECAAAMEAWHVENRR